MTASDFDKAFGTSQPSFVEKIARPVVVPRSPDGKAGEYKPYGFLPTNTVGETCDMQRWVDGTDIAEGVEFQYRFLLRVAYSGDNELRLYLPDLVILITGRNLRDLRQKLARRQATFVQQYSSRVWPVPPADNEALVASLDVLVP